MKDPEFKKILDNINDGIYFVNEERYITYWNKGAERITGYSAKQVIGHRCMDNLLNHVTENGVQLCLNGCPLHATIVDGIQRRAEVYLHHAKGYRLPVIVRTSPIQDNDGKIIGAVETFSDNTSFLKIRRKVGKLEKYVLLDPLTGIGNRRYIEMKLRTAMDEFQQLAIPVGVLFLDIDHFKLVNDSYGHNIGDKILQLVAKTLQKNIRTDDLIARWGGEEFLTILYGVNQPQLMTAAEKFRHLIKESQVVIENQIIKTTVSIGATMIRSEDNPESLVQRVDQNLYTSKLSGRNCVSGDEKRLGRIRINDKPT